MCKFEVKAVILETGRITLIFLWLFETRSHHLIYDDGRGRDRVKWNLEVLVPAGLWRPALYYSEEQSVRWNDKAVSALGFNQTPVKATKWNICLLLRNFSTLSLQDPVPLVLENVNLINYLINDMQPERVSDLKSTGQVKFLFLRFKLDLVHWIIWEVNAEHEQEMGRNRLFFFERFFFPFVNKWQVLLLPSAVD